MMSDKDGPPGGAVSVAVSAATSTAQNTTDSDMRQVWRFVYVDMSFVKSIPGLLLAGELVSIILEAKYMYLVYPVCLRSFVSTISVMPVGLFCLDKSIRQFKDVCSIRVFL